jgi:hypothetical protein
MEITKSDVGRFRVSLTEEFIEGVMSANPDPSDGISCSFADYTIFGIQTN